MIKLLSKQKTTGVAIDFGTCSFRAVQLRRLHNSWHVHHWINIETDPTSTEPPEIDYDNLLNLAFGPGTFTSKETSLLLNPPDVEYKLLELPDAVLNQPPTEMRNALRFELERQIPWSPDDMEIASWPVQPGATSKANIMVAAAQTSSIQRMLDRLDKQNLECTRADIVPNAIMLTCPQPIQDNPEGSALPMVGILDIGFKTSRLYLIHGNKPVFARVLRQGGRNFTEVLAKSLHVEFKAAEQYKRIYGICKTDRGFRTIVSGLSGVSEEALPGMLYSILQPTLEQMVSEIERSSQFALGRLPGVSAGPIFLIGGGARLKGLPDILSSLLKVPVCLPDPQFAFGQQVKDQPQSNHNVFSPNNYPALAGCIGLAMLEDAS